MTKERECSHHPRRHPYHYSITEVIDGKVYEHFHCGYCGKLVRSMRVK